MTSFIQYEAALGDPNLAQQVRNYLLGRGQNGNVINPCTWYDGEVLGGVNCSNVDSRFMYSGDPVSLYGWINIYPTDQRQVSSTGPFKLERDKPIDIIVAYVVGRGSTALQSVTLAKQITKKVRVGFLNNYKYPAPLSVVKPSVKTTDNSIELIWETSKDLNYRQQGRGYDMLFESYEVYMHETDTLGSGYSNKILLASYDVANQIKNVYYKDPLITYNRTQIYKQGIQLDSLTYSDTQKGRISLTIATDPFTNKPLIKGRPYFISIVSTAYNRDELKRLDASGNYVIPGNSVIGKLSTISPVLSDGISLRGIVPGKDVYTPFKTGVETEHYQGKSNSNISYDVIDKSGITDHQYEVSFFKDSTSELYDLYYRVTDLNINSTVLDSSKQYGVSLINDMIGGVTLNVDWINPRIISKEFTGGTMWFDPTERRDSVGIFYMGNDIDDSMGVVDAIWDNKSDVTKANDLKRVELRFGQTGKAYRYIKGLSTYRYAQDTGWVDVPFQAWVNDKTLGLEYQLAVGFTESALSLDTLANADGIYDPGFNVFDSKEYIIIFNTPYDPTGNQYEYTGNSARWANISDGFNLNRNDPRYSDSLKTIAASPGFNALYIAGLQRIGDPKTPMTGTYAINVSYPLTTNDRYRFTVNNNLSLNEEKDLFNKINVFPNPLFLYNPVTGYTVEPADEPYITFSYLPNQVTIKIYSLSGMLVKTLRKDDTSPFMKWDLLNEYENRVASGMYLAIISNPVFGDKVLKFAIIQPQKRN